MSTSGEEEEAGPNVDSNDPEERIAARRLRIQRRLELQKKAQMGEQLDEKKEAKEELTKSRKQMEESRLRLTKLKLDGFDLVTAIRVAGDAREAARRVEEDEARRIRKEKLDAEAKSGAERFDDITKKWESALQKEIPQDLHEMLMQQKAACDAMIDEKNKLINDFQMELKQKDDHYVKDLKKQADDIDLLIERMDEQVKQLTKAKREELDEIEKSFVAERRDMLELHSKKWEAAMQQRRDRELEYMKAREKRVEEYEQQLQHLRVQDTEEYNQVKIKLETDVQILQQQLQQMKATYQLNQEKLEYNFQVLRKRDDENMVTKSQQKRKITRLQDVLTNLKIKLAKQEKQYRDENQQLTDDYKRITEQFNELQKKSKHFMATDARKFHDVWCMNEEEAKQLVERVLEEDRVISVQQLGMSWEQPDLSFMDNVGPIMSNREKARGASAKEVLKEALSSTGGAGSGLVSGHTASETDITRQKQAEDGETEERRTMTIFNKLSHKTVKMILELLGDETGFLIESKLNKLLSPLERDEQNLMRLDAIFTALNIETEEDINILSGYFLSQQKDEQKPSTGREPQNDQGSVEDLDDEDREVQEVMGENDAESMDLEEGSTSHQSDRTTPPQLIHPNDVLKALRAFVEDHKAPAKEKGRSTQFKISGLEERDDSDDAAYWEKYPGVIPQKQERLWDALIDAFEKYSEVLTSRANLITETDALKQQNAELRMLLHQYVNSKVNQELEIPPTRVLQLELNPQ